jgi:multicomponent Na+:H+ antiporter subunit A
MSRPDPRMPRSLILDTGVRFVFHTILLYSVYLLFAGHNAPGGGFAGGLVAGAAFVLRYVSDVPGELRRVTGIASETLLAAGVFIASATGIAAWIGGGQFLESAKAELELPLLGHLAVTSVLAFDIGVYLVVVGLVGMVLQRLGMEPHH